MIIIFGISKGLSYKEGMDENQRTENQGSRFRLVIKRTFLIVGAVNHWNRLPLASGELPFIGPIQGEDEKF